MAADVVWLDGLVTNPDRTVANPNLLVWHGRIWLIDHGAALYIHHTWRDPDASAERAIRAHPRPRPAAVRGTAGRRPTTDWPAALGIDLFTDLVAAIPDAWLPDDPARRRRRRPARRLLRYLDRRLAARTRFVEEAERARHDA